MLERVDDGQPPGARQRGDPVLAHVPAQAREVLQHVGPRELVVELEVARQVADPPARGEHVGAEHLGAAGGRARQAQQHPHRRALARAVGAEEAEDLAVADLEVEVEDAAPGPVVLRQLLGADGGPRHALKRRLRA